MSFIRVSQIKTENVAGEFKNHLTNIGESLAREIPSVGTDPLSRINPVNVVFSSPR